MIRSTSKEAYKEELASGSICICQGLVLDVLKTGDYNNREIAEKLNKPINSITPRTKELRAKGLVGKIGYKKDDKTNRKTILWRYWDNK